MPNQDINSQVLILQITTQAGISLEGLDTNDDNHMNFLKQANSVFEGRLNPTQPLSDTHKAIIRDLWIGCIGNRCNRFHFHTDTNGTYNNNNYHRQDVGFPS